MANTFNEKELLPDRTSLALCHVKTGNPNWMINAAAGREAANSQSDVGESEELFTVAHHGDSVRIGLKASLSVRFSGPH
jgi:hypothetical protein